MIHDPDHIGVALLLPVLKTAHLKTKPRDVFYLAVTNRRPARPYYERTEKRQNVLLTVPCVPCHSWMVMLLVTVRYENSYDETLKERVCDESYSSLSG